jgi:hypothetical protein
MGVSQPFNVAYGLSQSLLNVFPQPIVSKRSPTIADKAQIGQTWVNESSNDIFFLTSIVNNEANWLTPPGGSGSFTSLTATTGNITATLGNIVASAGSISAATSVSAGTTISATTSISAGTTITAGTGLIVSAGGANILGTTVINTTGSALTSIGSNTAASGIVLKGGTSGIVITPTAGNISIAPVSSATASPTDSVTMNNRIGLAAFTGFTTAQGDSQVFTVDNSNVLIGSLILVSVSNFNASTNGALMTITGIIQGAGFFSVTATNNGAAALGAGDDVHINFWVLS